MLLINSRPWGSTYTPASHTKIHCISRNQVHAGNMGIRIYILESINFKFVRILYYPNFSNSSKFSISKFYTSQYNYLNLNKVSYGLERKLIIFRICTKYFTWFPRKYTFGFEN